MSDQQEDPPPDVEAARIDRERQDREEDPSSNRPVDESQTSVIVEIETPSEVRVKAVLEFTNDFETPGSADCSESSEWIEDEVPSIHGIFGPLVILCWD